SLSIVPANVGVTACTQFIPFTMTLGSFTDSNASATSSTSDYTATIDWGDGLNPTSATISPNQSGGFNIIGTHAYMTAQATPFNAKVTVYDGSTSWGTFTQQFTVTSNNQLQKPAPPTLVQSEANTVEISWASSPAVTGMIIVRHDLTDGTVTTIAGDEENYSFPATGTRYVDQSGLTAGHTYEYTIQAVW